MNIVSGELLLAPCEMVYRQGGPLLRAVARSGLEYQAL